MMNNQIVTGIGCFARPEKLSRIFLKWVQAYSLGQIGAADLVKGCTGTQPGSTELIKALIAGKAAGSGAAVHESADRHDNNITGFFLAFKENSLELSIFAKSRNSRREIHSAVLDKLSRFRRKRLN